MKKIFVKTEVWCLLLVIIFCASSCDDVFDVERTGVLTSDKLWSNTTLVTGYVNGFYSILPNGENSNLWSDESTWSLDRTPLLVGTMENNDYPGEVWDYGTVRNINNFIANINKITAPLTENQLKYLVGQAHFFRAYQYYKMVKVLGGVPIITEVQSPTDDANKLMVKRNTTLECFNFIVDELNTAISNLPNRGAAGYESGRITKEGAMAVKAEVLLLKASPLFCSTPEATFWQEAYDAAMATKTELDATGYGLYENDKYPGRSVELMFYEKEKALKEMVVYVPYSRDIKNSGIVGSNGTGSRELTWNIVQSFPMATGKNIEDPNSGYNEKYFWRDRDPRFYATVVWNGAIFGQSMDGEAVIKNRRHFMYSDLGGELGWHFANAYGIVARKGVDTTLVKRTRGTNQAFDWPIIRYSEVLLNLAECANELPAHRTESLVLIKQIRQRSRVLPGADNRYGLATGVGTDRDVTFNAIVKERQVELMLEGKRFWDLRRWRMFNVLNEIVTPLGYGPVLDKSALQTALGTTENNISVLISRLQSYLSTPPAELNVDDFLYKFTSFSKEPAFPALKFNIKDYYYFGSISRDEIKKNSNLLQNKGWDNGTFNPMIK